MCFLLICEKPAMSICNVFCFAQYFSRYFAKYFACQIFHKIHLAFPQYTCMDEWLSLKCVDKWKMAINGE